VERGCGRLRKVLHLLEGMNVGGEYFPAHTVLQPSFKKSTHGVEGGSGRFSKVLHLLQGSYVRLIDFCITQL